MNVDDKKILDLLKRNRAIKAPENFTDNVMSSIIKFEESKQNSFQLNTIFAGLLMLATIVASVGVFYFFDKSLIENVTSYFAVLSEFFTHQFGWFNTYFVQFTIFVQHNIFAFGLGFMLIALLSFEKIILKRKISMNMLTIV